MAKENDKLRKLLTEIVQSLPQDKQEEARDMIKDTLREHLVVHTQKTIVQAAEDISDDPFEFMIEIIPAVACDLLKSMIVNIIGNADPQRADEIEKTVGHLKDFVNSTVFEADIKRAIRLVHKEMTEAVMRGDLDTFRMKQ